MKKIDKREKEKKRKKGKEKVIVVAFSDNWGSSVILHQNSVSLAVMCILKPDQWKFCVHIALK